MISSNEAVAGTINEEIEEQEVAEAVETEATETPVDGTNAEPEETQESAESRHYAEIRELNEQVLDSQYEWQRAKDEASAAKKDYDRLSEKLQRLIAHGPDRQRRLFAEKPAANVVVDAFRSHDVAELGLTKSLTEGLRDLGLNTLGELQDYWKSGKHLHDEKNWGPEKSAKVSDAFADFGVAHPELFGPQGESESADGDDAAEGEESDAEDSEE